jgi:hypothetical protein
MNDATTIPLIDECVGRLASAAKTIGAALPPPQIVDVSGQKQYRYTDHTPYHVAFLKGLRVVSGLNACLYLLAGGYAQEIMVIIRTLDDFTAEIVFILEKAEAGTLTQHQKKFLADFFREEFVNSNNPLLNEDRRDTVPNKNIIASFARQAGPYANPSDLQKMFMVTNDALSGYVHGAYPHIMEMFGGGPPQFHLQGMRGSPRIPMCIRQMEVYTHRAIMVFDVLAKNLGSAELSEFLVQTRDHFEKGTGYTQPPDLNKEIRRQKKRR